MTDKDGQIRNGLIYLVPLAVNSVFPFIIISVFTRILTKEDFGIWGLAQVYAIFASGLTNLGMLTAYDRNFFQFRDDQLKSAQLLFSCLGFVLFNFTFIGGLTYVFRNALAAFVTGSAGNGAILFFAFCAHFFHGMLSYYLIYYKNSGKALDYSKNIIAFSILNLSFSLIFVAWFRIGVIGLIFAQLLAGIIVFFILSLQFFRKLKFSLDMGILRQSVVLAYPLTPRIFLGVISSQFDKYMIGMLSSVGGVGIYSIGQKVASAIFSIMTAVQNVFAPQVYTRMFDSGDEGGALVGKYLTPFAYICVAPALMVALFAEEIFYILAPADFHDAVDIVIILAMFYSLMFFGKQPQLIYAKKTSMITFLSFFSVGLNIALNIPFILKWGALGAAWATLLSGFISTTVSFLVSQYYYRIGWEYQKISEIYFLFFVSVISVMVLNEFAFGYGIRFLVKLVFVFFYICLGIRLGILCKDNLIHVKNAIVKKSVSS